MVTGLLTFMQTFQIPAFILPPKQPKEKKAPEGEPVILHVEAENRKAALQQCREGAVLAKFKLAHPGKRLKVNFSRLRRTK